MASKAAMGAGFLIAGPVGAQVGHAIAYSFGAHPVGGGVIEVTCMEDAERRFVSSVLTKASQPEYTPAVQRMDWTATNADTLRQAQIGAAILGGLVLATAATVLL